MAASPRLHPFRPRLLDALQGYNRQRLVIDVGAGITVAIVALPLALAFGIASGVKPEQGLITAIVAGFLISALGGSQVQIGGPAGAFIVIVYGIVERYGLANLLICTAMAGVLMFVMGLFKLGVLVRHIPVSIVIGFTSGIAVLIALSQLRDLLGLNIAKMPGEFFAQIQTLAQHIGSVNPTALSLGVACVGGLALWPKLFKSGLALPASTLEEGPLGHGAFMPTRKATRRATLIATRRASRLASRLPAPIVALVTLTAATWWFHLPVETIGSRFGELTPGLPHLDLALPGWDDLRQLLIPTLTIALLGAVESLLSARVADNLGETQANFKRHDPNQELMAQGVANFVTPLLGGIPATGTIARTMINVRAGATSPVSGIVHAITLLLILLLAAPLASHVPLAALAGILLFVAWNMFEGHQFRRLKQFSTSYRVLMVGSFVLTIVFDLMVAVEVGLVLACVFFIWRMGTLFSVKPVTDHALPAGVHAVALYGSLFFGAVGKVEGLEEQLPAGTRVLVLDMQRLISMDTSGLDALQQLHRSLKRLQVALVMANVNEQPLSLMRRSGFEAELGAGHIVPNMLAAMEAQR